MPSLPACATRAERESGMTAPTPDIQKRRGLAVSIGLNVGLVCPHAVIRAKLYSPEALGGAPATFKSTKPRWKEFEHLRYSLQVAPEDCTGCSLCVQICPVKSKTEVKH